MKLEELREDMREVLTNSRYIHSLGVEEVSCDLALIHGGDMEDACIAGILHDCAKCKSDEELTSICLSNGIVITKQEEESKQLLHGKVGAFIAKEKYGITKQSIIDAIVSHTTGRPNMSLLEKIIFVADYIEPNRKPLPNIDRIRRHAYEDLDLAVYEILKNVLNYLKESKIPIDDTSVRTLEYYEACLKGRKTEE